MPSKLTLGSFLLIKIKCKIYNLFTFTLNLLTFNLSEIPSLKIICEGAICIDDKTKGFYVFFQDLLTIFFMSLQNIMYFEFIL